MIDLPDPIITQAEILEKTGWSESTLADKIYRGNFPRKISWSRKHRRIFSRAQFNKYWNPDMDNREGGFKNA